MIQLIRIFIFSALAFVVIGCASNGNKSIAGVTEAYIESIIVAGETTKDQIQARFGSPIETTYTDSGLLIWTYRYDDTSMLTLATAGSLILTRGIAGTKTTGTRSALVVLFNENDVVMRFNMSNSTIEAGTGIF